MLKMQLANAGDELRQPRRVLQALQGTINHDLPNMLVALQGLLQMLDLEERERLTEIGQEYLHRLQTITQRLQGTVSTLRAINKVSLKVPPAERLALADLLAEWTAVSKQLFPQVRLSVQTQADAADIQAPRALLQQCLLEIIRLLLAEASAEAVPIYLAFRQRQPWIELGLSKSPLPAASPDTPTNGSSSATPEAKQPWPGEPDYDCLGAECRLQLILLAELAIACGGAFQVYNISRQARAFYLYLLPAPLSGDDAQTHTPQ